MCEKKKEAPREKVWESMRKYLRDSVRNKVSESETVREKRKIEVMRERAWEEECEREV